MIVTDGAHQIPIPHMKGGEAHFSPGRNLQSTSLVIGQGEVHILIDLPDLSKLRSRFSIRCYKTFTATFAIVRSVTEVTSVIRPFRNLTRHALRMIHPVPCAASYRPPAVILDIVPESVKATHGIASRMRIFAHEIRFVDILRIKGL